MANSIFKRTNHRRIDRAGVTRDPAF
jgi:hypothetical protein